MQSVSNKWALIFLSLDNLIIDNYDRKFHTYREVGWSKEAIEDYLSKKENALKIASFTTKYVSFTASSRRNRFYEVYNRPDMLEKDKPWQDSVKYINESSERFQIFIISSRAEDMKNKTLQLLKEWGFQLEGVEVFFKKSTEVLNQYRTRILRKIKEDHFNGFGVALSAQEASILDRFGYIPVGFSSINDPAKIGIPNEHVSGNWQELFEIIDNIYKDELQESGIATGAIASGNLNASYSSNTDECAPSGISNASYSSNTDPSGTAIDNVTQATNNKPSYVPESSLEKVIYHQLFIGQNRIMGTCNDDDITEFMGVGALIRAFTKDLKNNLKLIFTYPDRFFEYYQKIFESDLSDVIGQIQTNLAEMMQFQTDKLISMYLVLTKLLEGLRLSAFKQYGINRLIIEYNKKSNTDEGDSGNSTSNILKEVLNLESQGEPNVSYLSDLSFIAALTKAYSNQLLSFVIFKKMDERISTIIDLYFKK